MKHRNPVETLASARHEFGEHGGVNMSVEASTTFTVMHSSTMPDIFGGKKGPEKGGCYLYGRHFNPTVYTLGKQLAALEGTEAAYCTASGMSAISATLLQLCDANDHIVSSNTVYGGTYALMHDLLPPKTGISTTLVDITDLDAVEAAITDRTRVIYTESVANPTLRVADIPRLSAIARRHGIKLVVDNTFSPLVLSPIKLGADIVVHSMTKFINGASDYIAGAICADAAFIQEMMDLHTGMLMILGPTMDPQVAFNINLRIPHLPLRMTEHSKRTQLFAERLQDLGMTVSYPGLAAHPDHELMSELHCPDYGYGGILTLDMGTVEKANELLDLLQNEYQFGYVAVSLGYFDTLMSCSGSSTSSEMTDEDKAAAAISQGLVRLSIGYTGTIEQRWNQMEEALRRVGAISRK
ncbi:MAG: aminotransferase class I/II-fold pyridoxal phosphate-dependent enzyme [Xanthomonadales bacterium]|nr:aminotransferase class I/II-fold pyridoxal phosphate-dependent enzyme [Gammaproteobacteria bacterium]MBT8072236.1 aminotransferase class I/II-fold pyridoxal phosphate-dependent enzyme [Gammaproteobacteria bacterium]NNK03077.1 aminotransferase class I/II-fold pyridoxal phosphate-dependent enzyme [Xanthomonadales bacterium]NNK99778.1 aminotransferase class I/II-fold pyridoxal phosphate-dependent enzyme [Xanthomonadales bacterium]